MHQVTDGLFRPREAHCAQRPRCLGCPPAEGSEHALHQRREVIRHHLPGLSHDFPLVTVNQLQPDVERRRHRNRRPLLLLGRHRDILHADASRLSLEDRAALLCRHRDQHVTVGLSHAVRLLLLRALLLHLHEGPLEDGAGAPFNLRHARGKLSRTCQPGHAVSHSTLGSGRCGALSRASRPSQATNI